MDVSEDSFQADVIERSHEVPVVVDFWAEWCGPCRQLGPIVDDAIARRTPDMELAKIDIDANPGLAQRFQVLSIPAVKAFRSGEVVEEFVGLVSAAQMETFLDKLVPSKVDMLVEAGDESSLREAVERDAGRTDARIALAHILIGNGEVADAATYLAPAEHDPIAAGLLARTRLMGSDVPDIQAGVSAIEREDWQQAFASLIDAVTVSTDRRQRDDLRKMLIGQFRELGDGHPLVPEYRKRHQLTWRPLWKSAHTAKPCRSSPPTAAPSGRCSIFQWPRLPITAWPRPPCQRLARPSATTTR